MIKRILLSGVAVLLLSSLTFTTTHGAEALKIDFSKVQVNTQKQAIFNQQLNNIFSNLKSHLPLGESRITSVKMLYPNDLNKTCDIAIKNVLVDGCYFPNTGLLLINSDVFGSSTEAMEVTAHEILHSFVPRTNGSNLSNTAENGRAFEEMLVEYFANKAYPSTAGGYDWLEEYVPDLKAIIKATGNTDPDSFLANALFKGSLTDLNTLLGPSLDQSDFLAGLGRYISDDPSKNNNAKAMAYLQAVLDKVSQCNSSTNTSAPGSGSSTSTPPSSGSNNPPASSPVCPVKTSPTSTSSPTSSAASSSSAGTSTASTCDGNFKVSDFFDSKGDGLLPPFLRTANSSQNADFSCIGAFIRFYSAGLAWLIAILAFLYLLYGAFLYMTAFGEDAKATAAKKVITQALTGVVLAALAYTIISIVNSILGGKPPHP